MGNDIEFIVVGGKLFIIVINANLILRGNDLDAYFGVDSVEEVVRKTSGCLKFDLLAISLLLPMVDYGGGTVRVTATARVTQVPRGVALTFQLV